jgi:hypothetical protein
MPTVMTLQGASIEYVMDETPRMSIPDGSWLGACSSCPRSDLGEDNRLTSFLRERHPLVAGAMILTMSMGAGLAVGGVTVAALNAYRRGEKSKGRALAGARRRRR